MKSLMASRKFWLTVAGIAFGITAVVVCALKGMTEMQLLALEGVIVILVRELVKGIALEDAASKTQPVAQAGTIYNATPPASALQSTIPPPRWTQGESPR